MVALFLGFQDRDRFYQRSSEIGQQTVLGTVRSYCPVTENRTAISEHKSDAVARPKTDI